LKGTIQLDAKTIIIPQDAILINKSIKNGKYIGRSAWIRGEIEHQEEVAGWEMKQAQLRKIWGKDNKDEEDEREVDSDYY
jgi:hypothetical protein